MDPKECLRLLLDALDDGRWNDATEHSEDLLGWLRMGGFPPKHDSIDGKIDVLVDDPSCSDVLIAYLDEINAHLGGV